MTDDKRRTDACLKACEGISTQNLEDNVPVLELARRYNVVLRERDALRAKIEQMEWQEPVWFIDERGEPKRYHKSKADYCKYGGLDLLYALPGAKGE